MKHKECKHIPYWKLVSYLGVVDNMIICECSECKNLFYKKIRPVNHPPCYGTKKNVQLKNSV